MIELNLTANTESEKRILEYLQNNVSETLADKVNNGTPFEKDGKPLLNKKTLADFMKYAYDEARKLAEKGANSACIEDSVVYGWAIHFFEKESIVGTLYNLDGTEYKPVVKAAAKPITKPVVTETKPKQVQWSLFDMVNETARENEVKDTANDTLTEELDTNDEEFTEEEKLDAMRQVAEEEQSQTVESITEEAKGNQIYQDYRLYQSERPTAVVALRLGDFYEVLGENAVMLGNEMDLTITSRDVGLKERIPMVGFPYHAAEKYFAKIVKKHDLYIVENERDTQFIPSLLYVDNQLIDQDTGEIIDVTPIDDCTEKRQYVPPKHDQIIDYLTELFGNEMEIKL